MDLTYKNADESDIECIFNLNKNLIDQYEDIKSIDYEKVLLWVHKKIERHIYEYKCIIFEGKKVGYYFFHKVDSKMEMDDLYVFEGYRNLGIGTTVLNNCFEETDLPIFLYVFKKNIKAIKLYSLLGFRVSEVCGNTRYIMQKQDNI